MEIVGEAAHRLLAYVEAVQRQGHALTLDEFNAYDYGHERLIKVSGNSRLAKSIQLLQNSVSEAMWGEGHRDVESTIEYLTRLRWLSTEAGIVTITSLGKAVLREANSPLPDSDVGSTLEVVIDPNNPFAYAQLMSKVSGFEACMIVDPYLDLDQLTTLMSFQSVTKILTSNKHARKNKPVFSLVLADAPHLEVRMAQEKLLHDRLVIPSEGKAMVLGSSLNSITRRFGVATSLEESTSRLIRSNYGAIWEAAEGVERSDPEPVAAVSGATTDEGTGV